MAEKTRVFIAVEINESVKQSLNKVQKYNVLDRFELSN